MIVSPTEDLDSMYDNVKAWEKLGIVVKPFFATPYPGSEWYHVYKERIMEQYAGDIEKFLLDLGDATKVTGVICENFDAVELYGLRELMINFDYRRIDEYERKWKTRTHERVTQPTPPPVASRPELILVDPSVSLPRT